jgi:hypothetical protein
MIAVWTTTSCYLIGRVEQTLTRFPGQGLDVGADGSWPVAELRRDGETVELLAVEQLEVGQPALFVVRLYPQDAPATVTLRLTTRVRAVQHMS